MNDTERCDRQLEERRDDDDAFEDHVGSRL